MIRLESTLKHFENPHIHVVKGNLEDSSNDGELITIVIQSGVCLFVSYYLKCQLNYMKTEVPVAE